MIVISDINPSYDSDKVPGSYFSSYSGDISGLDVKDLADSIGNEERIPENPHFIGQSGSNYDFICSVKDVSELGESRGLCPEEPTKQGSYYSASIAYYGKTRFREDLNRPNIATYTVALSSPVPKIKIKLGNHTVTLVPVGKSVSGCINVYNYCARKCTLTYDSTRGLIIKNCSSNSYCPSNQIVDFYVTKIASNSGKFSINYEDVEQGADHDMDAIVTYEYKVIDNNHVKIKLSSDYAAGCIDQVMGFVISGTSEDGLYLPVRDKDSGNCDGDTPSVVCNMPLTWEHTFTVSDTPTATLLKNPLWYAAKWGGFEDLNNNNEPDLTTEWDKDGDGVPDNYFFVTNPLKLYEQLDKVFKAVLNRSGSAGAVATVTQEVLGEDIVIRGAFTTYEPTDPSTYVWKGHLEVYWPYEGCSAFDNEETCESISGCSWVNNQCTGTIYSFQLSENEGKFCTDSGFQGGHCWDAGEKLSNQGTRTIFTFINNQKTDFSFANVNNYLDLDSECDFDGDGNVDDNDKQKLVNWVVGTEDGDGTHMRNRNGWLLGDIVYSTPLVVGQPSLGSVAKVVAKDSCKALQPCFQYKNETDCSSHLNDYGCYWDRIDGTCEAMDCSRLNETVCNNQPVCQWDATEGVCEEVSVSSDSCFYTWRLKDDIAHRKKVAYVGANDGMLHAFLVGVWWDDPEPSTDSDGDGEADESHWIYNPDEPDSLCDGFICTGKEDIGQELWAYIPSNLLSELKELAKPTYGKEAGCQHKTMVDLSPEAWDVYMDLDNDGIKEWHTILIGGERGGGDVYFAIDVTDPEDPQVLWEFSTLRNMVYVSGSNGNYSADMPYLDKNGYDQIKTIAASWSNPYVGRIKIPDNYCFYSIPHIGPLDNNPSNLTALCYGGSQYPLSGWFAFIGGGIRVFDPSYELISGDNGAAYYPYFIVLDIKTGTNIFQFLWPLLRLHAGITTIHQNSNYIPYAVASPVALDIWDENGNLGQDGYMDHLYAGDLNGNFYGIKLNPSNNSFPLSLDIWNTKPISSSHVSDNYYRWTRQPITVTPTAAFDDNYNLMLYFGTGKFDDVVAGGYDDKTDRARMSFYALKDPSSAPSVLLPACQPIGSSPFTINCTLPSGITTIHGCSSFNSNCTWVKDDGTPDCCESNCSSSCYSCIYDFIEDGERVIDSALVAGGLVFVTTYVPSDDPCAAGGVGYLYVFDYMCRQLTENPFENADLQYEHLSQTGWTQGAPSGGGAKAYRANLGSGMPSKPVLDSGGEHVLIQTSDAKIHRIKVKLPQNPLYLKGWKEKE
ncbi:MAG: hypothetical protein DRG39_02200 [Deltaproteobacteria bacterium]|nr:MAG: hypothetical protein DRG39_02200 [Deltaproteobacteria bacterium]